MKSLHDLPKDMLIEIILNVKKQHEKEKERLLRECHGAYHNFCAEGNCNEFSIIGPRDEVIYSTTDGKILICHICKDNFCEKHEKMFFCDICEYSQCKKHHKCVICKTPICSYCNKNSKCKNCSLNLV